MLNRSPELVTELIDADCHQTTDRSSRTRAVLGEFDLDQTTCRYEDLYSGLLSAKSAKQPEVGSLAPKDPDLVAAESMTSTSTHGRKAKRLSIAGFLIVMALIALRLVHLGADPPDSLWTQSLGPFVDEGYKTLDARNLALFGQTHWNDQDDYPGWLPRSPITQVSFLAAFRILGQEIVSARVVTVLWFLLILLIYLWAISDSYGPWITLLGLATA